MDAGNWIGLASLAVATLTLLFGLSRRFDSRIAESERRCESAVRERQQLRDGQIGELWGQLNNVKENYVRRDDLDQRMASIERQVISLTEKADATTREIHALVGEVRTLTSCINRRAGA